MSSILISLFSFGCLDFFSPSGLAILTLLASLVKKKRHLLVFIISEHVAYYTAACAIYFGIGKYLKRFVSMITERFPVALGIAEIILGIAAAIGGIVLFIHLIRKLKNREEPSVSKIVHIQSSAPWFLALFAFGYVWGSIYACYPLLGFIAVLTSQDVPFGIAALWLMAFCMFSTTYKLIIFFIIVKAKNSQKVEKVLNRIGRIMSVVLFFALAGCLLYIAWRLLKSGLPVIL